MWRVWIPASASAPRDAATVRLMLWAPDEPPVTMSTGFSGCRPSAAQGAVPRRGPDHGRDFAAHGHAHMPGVAQRGAGEGHGHVPAQPRTHPVGQARAGVGLVDDDGDLPPPGGEVHGRADVAAHSHEDVRAGVVEDAPGLLDRAGEAAGQPQQIRGGPARERDAVNGGQLEPGGRNQPGLHAGGRSDGEQPGVGARIADGGGDGQQRIDMACRSAAGEDHGQ